jgi:hypothetical protein
MSRSSATAMRSRGRRSHAARTAEARGRVMAVLEERFDRFAERLENAPDSDASLEKRVVHFVNRSWEHFSSPLYRSTFEILLNLPPDLGRSSVAPSPAKRPSASGFCAPRDRASFDSRYVDTQSAQRRSPGIHLAWNPIGTRAGRATLAIGPLAMPRAAKTQHCERPESLLTIVMT